MALKFKFTELFRGKFPIPQTLYKQLENLQDQIENGADAKPITKSNVKLNKTSLKKAFGDPSKFESIGIVNNAEGSYLVVANEKEFKIVSLEDI